MTDNESSRPYRRRADQTMDVLAAKIPLLLLADLAGEGNQGTPVQEADSPAAQGGAEQAATSEDGS